MFWFNKKAPKPYEAKLPGQTLEPKLEVHSPTWKFIEALALKKIEELRRQNDSPKKDLAATNYIRGRIKELNELLDLKDDGRDNRPGILNRHFAGEED